MSSIFKDKILGLMRTEIQGKVLIEMSNRDVGGTPLHTLLGDAHYHNVSLEYINKSLDYCLSFIGECERLTDVDEA